MDDIDDRVPVDKDVADVEICMTQDGCLEDRRGEQIKDDFQKVVQDFYVSEMIVVLRGHDEWVIKSAGYGVVLLLDKNKRGEVAQRIWD
jgi:hypothetical protein